MINLVTDALGQVSVQEFAFVQGVKKITRMVEPSGAATSFTYDSNLNLLTQTDPLGRITRYTYDALGNVTVTEDPAGGRTLASYEPAFNQVASLTDPLSKTTLMSYDPKGNLTRIEDPLAGVSLKGYDAFGHVSCKATGSSWKWGDLSTARPARRQGRRSRAPGGFTGPPPSCKRKTNNAPAAARGPEVGRTRPKKSPLNSRIIPTE